MVRLVLFDIDGTLIHTGGAGERAFGKVCDAEFHVPDGTRGLNFAGRTDPSIVRDFFHNHGIDPSAANFRRFFEQYVVWLERLLIEMTGRVLPGIVSMIEDMRSLAEPPVVGLLTGNIRQGARIKLTHYGLWQHFPTGGFGDDHEDRNEVARVALERGIKHLGEPLKGHQVVVIGDTPRDVECGRAIGARTLAVATGKYSTEELRSQGADWTVTTLEGLSAEEICG